MVYDWSMNYIIHSMDRFLNRFFSKRLRKKAGIGSLIALSALLLIGILAFSLRRPILLISDQRFQELYGAGRARKSHIAASLRLFRPIRVILAPETGGYDILLFALEEKLHNPYCVVFPYRFEQEARIFARDFQEIPLFLLAGNARALASSDGLRIVSTDTHADYYRAGAIAALFATQNQGNTGEIVFFQDFSITSEDRDAFQQGLEDRGYQGNPLYINYQADYIPPETAACVVVRTGAERFLLEKSAVPVIIFSWIDPALTPDKIKAVFNDSPWAQLVPLLRKGIPQEDQSTLPSEVFIHSKRISDARLLRAIRTEIHGYPP